MTSFNCRFVMLMVAFLLLTFALSIMAEPISKMNPPLKSLVSSYQMKLKSPSSVGSLMNKVVEIYENEGEEPIVGVIVNTSNPEELKSIPNVKVGSVIGDIATAYLPISALYEVEKLSSVKSIKASVYHKPYLDKSIPETKANQVWSGSPSYKGTGVLVCIYDTGIDWTHADFKDANGKSRILYILDQTKTPYNPPGVEWSKSQIDAGSCNEVDTNGHGTHVAGTVAGDGSSSTSGYIGMAPEADILAVRGGTDGFTSAKEIDGVNWAMNKATTLGKPIVINMSLGGHVGPHDGTSDQEVAIDNASGAGKIVVIAAGNEGDKAIHASGSLGTSLSKTINIPSYSGTGAYLVVDCWYPSSTSTSVTLQTPSGTFGPVGYGSELNQSGVYIWNGDGKNGTGGSTTTDKEIYIEVSEPGSGNFTLTFSGGSGTLDAWITSNVDAEFTTGNFTKHVSIPGTCKRAITVGSYVTRWCWPSKDYPSYSNAYCYSGHSSSDAVGVISSFSNPGPSRDGRQKPEITAPGQAIMATRSKDASFYSYDIAPDNAHVRMQGTSMATPHVCGGIALMLQKEPTLTPEDIKSIFQNTAKKDSYTGTTPNYTWGYGKMDILAAVNGAQSCGLKIGVFQNPAFTQYIDIYAVSDTALPNPPSATVNGTSIGTMNLIDATNNIYQIDCQLSQATTNVNVLISQCSYPFTAKQIASNTGGIIQSIDKSLTLNIPPSALSQSMYLTVLPMENLTESKNPAMPALPKAIDGNKSIGTIYNLSPSSITLSKPASLICSYNPNEVSRDEENRIGIYRLSDSKWEYIGGTINKDNHTVSVNIDRLGIYQLQIISAEAFRQLSVIPRDFVLEQNQPNPFNPETVIRYGIRDTGYEMQVSSIKYQVSSTKYQVSLKIYSINGQLVRTLVNKEQSPGYYSVKWNGKDDSGISLPSGIYVYKLVVGDFSQSRRMVLMK